MDLWSARVLRQLIRKKKGQQMLLGQLHIYMQKNEITQHIKIN